MDSGDEHFEYVLDSNLIYLNTAALGPTPRVVLACVQEAWRELAEYPNRVDDCRDIYERAEQAREQCASFIGCRADELLITRGTTDSMNIIAQSVHLNAGDRVLTTDREHDGGALCWRYLARRTGAIVDTVPVAVDHDPHTIVKRFAAGISSKTRIISVSHVIASTGLRMPVADIANLARQHGIVCVVDGAQAVGNIELNVKSLGCHAYATSGHKWLMGPKGTGLLYVSRDGDAVVEPIEWENASSFIGNPALTIGLGAAVKAMQSRGMAVVERHNVELRNRCYEGLARIPNVEIVGPPPGQQATAILSIRLPGSIDSDRVRMTLREKYNIVVKTVERKWFNGIRIAPHVLNTEADIDALLEALRETLT